MPTLTASQHEVPCSMRSENVQSCTSHLLKQISERLSVMTRSKDATKRWEAAHEALEGLWFGGVHVSDEAWQQSVALTRKLNTYQTDWSGADGDRSRLLEEAADHIKTCLVQLMSRDFALMTHGSQATKTHFGKALLTLFQSFDETDLAGAYTTCGGSGSMPAIVTRAIKRAREGRLETCCGVRGTEKECDQKCLDSPGGMASVEMTEDDLQSLAKLLKALLPDELDLPRPTQS